MDVTPLGDAHSTRASTICTSVTQQMNRWVRVGTQRVRIHCTLGDLPYWLLGLMIPAPTTNQERRRVKRDSRGWGPPSTQTALWCLIIIISNDSSSEVQAKCCFFHDSLMSRGDPPWESSRLTRAAWSKWHCICLWHLFCVFPVNPCLWLLIIRLSSITILDVVISEFIYRKLWTS